MLTEEKKQGYIGLAEAVGCQLIWGIMAIYWKLVSTQPTVYCLAYRMVWASVFIILLGVFIKKVSFLPLLKDKRALLIFVSAGGFSALNWALYIWAASSGHLLETSIGYYLSPLCTILLGLVIFKEKLSPFQTVAVFMALVGVGIFIMLNGGAIWISLMLAFTFGIYGAIKKLGNYPALPGMMVESLLTGVIGVALMGIGMMFPAVWGIIPPSNDPIAVTDPMMVKFLLIFSGVMTAIPLLLYSASVNKVTLILVGFLGYISPTMELAFGVFLFGEAFTLAHGICLGLIWLGIILASIEQMIGVERLKRINKKPFRNLSGR